MEKTGVGMAVADRLSLALIVSGFVVAVRRRH
jgi:hypothetical protein